MNLLTLTTLAQADPQISDGAGAAIAGAFLIFYFAIIAVFIAAYWKIFTKAGKPGWAALVPIYNAIVLLEIVGRPVWWIILLFIPFVNVVVGIILVLDLTKSFGKSSAFAVGLILLSPIFILILAFDDSRYQGPAVTG